VLPGGVANPDQLRIKEKAIEFVRSFFEPADQLDLMRGETNRNVASAADPDRSTS